MPIYFALIPIGVLSFLYSFVGWRLLGPMHLDNPVKLLSWLFVLLAATFPILSVIMLFTRFEDSLSDLVSWLAYLSLGFASILFVFLIVKDLAVFSSFAFSKLVALFQPEVTGTNSPSNLGLMGEGRRRLLWTTANLAVLSAAGVMTGTGIVLARQKVKIERVSVPLANLPQEFEGLRIAQISDVHVGPTIKGDFVKEIVQQVNALKADMIVFTGDAVDGSVGYLSGDVAPFADLQSPLGKFFITGNHEYYSGVFSWLNKFKELGFDSLLNEHRVISRNNANLVLGGVTDLRAERMIPEHKTDPGASLVGAPEDAPKILLAHQPVSVYEAAKAGYDLQLSGHTHGGQYFPFSKLIRFAQPFIAGLYKYENTWLYVNRGTGYWGPPLRLGAPAEITEITLTKAV